METVLLSERLTRLRSVTGLIDISKSTLQLDIILALNSRGELSPAEIASILGQRRKAVTDAMRKLRIKGLVEPASENGKSATYRLTALGGESIKAILGFLEDRGEPQPSLVYQKSMELGSFALASALSQLLFTLGTAKGNALPIEELAGVMGLSVQR
ncbi:MAG: MarR family winged helix-turn-helix transcriptional regulator, partial [Candidatus Verstraetearchaeota archaeon]|nr:MarR family winged helix-turn-helix transcriptional regulator [Candidatus Verstraetearchaeota archaeon]